MSRETKYRGKRKDTGEWVYGYLVICPLGDTHLIFSGDFLLINNCGCAEWTREVVIPETVGQWTDLNDIEGVCNLNVYEGDIVSFTVFDCLGNDSQYIGCVVYSGSRFMIWRKKDCEFYGDDGGFDLDWVVAQDDEFKIIGTVFDNPELLEDDQ